MATDVKFRSFSVSSNWANMRFEVTVFVQRQGIPKWLAVVVKQVEKCYASVRDSMYSKVT